MRITAVTRFRNTAFCEARKQAGLTMVALSAAVGRSIQFLYHLQSLRARPSPEIAAKLQTIFGERGVYLDVEAAWPENFVPL